VAFQITNILRDLREDAARGRLYLPREDLRAAKISEQELQDGLGGDRFVKLVQQQIARIESFYDQSALLESRLEPDSRPTMVAMTEIYRGLLTKIAQDPQRVLRERVSLSLIHKLRIGWKATRAVRRGARVS
jgi:phytoene synthase